MVKKEELLNHLDQVHTTPLGIKRIRKNLKLINEDAVLYCKRKILDENCYIYKKGKNWYAEVDNCKITINSYNYTIITAHKMKK